MIAQIDSLLRRAEATPWSQALRESIWTYPIIEGVHVLTIALFVGFAVLLDLRLMGVFLRRMPVSRVAGALLPRTHIAFGIMVISGALLFSAKPYQFAQNLFFQIKAVLILVAAVNIFFCHRIAMADMARWDHEPRPPGAVRISGFVSILCWCSVVICGRLIAYNWFQKFAT